MSSTTVIAPLLPGKQELLRRIMQETLGTRRKEYETSRCRLGITWERALILHTSSGEVLLLSFSAYHPEQAFLRFLSSDLPFDRWFKRCIQECINVQMFQFLLERGHEVILEWQGEMGEAAKKSVWTGDNQAYDNY